MWWTVTYINSSKNFEYQLFLHSITKFQGQSRGNRCPGTFSCYMLKVTQGVNGRARTGTHVSWFSVMSRWLKHNSIIQFTLYIICNNGFYFVSVVFIQDGFLKTDKYCLPWKLWNQSYDTVMLGCYMLWKKH